VQSRNVGHPVSTRSEKDGVTGCFRRTKGQVPRDRGPLGKGERPLWELSPKKKLSDQLVTEGKSATAWVRD
jgi:hypothetical protein